MSSATSTGIDETHSTTNSQTNATDKTNNEYKTKNKQNRDQKAILDGLPSLSSRPRNPATLTANNIPYETTTVMTSAISQ